MGFENDRKWIIEKKNDVAIKAMDNKERTDQFIEKRDEVEEGISRIPTDLPEEIQRQVDAAIENARNDLKDESEKLESEANDIQRDADEVMDISFTNKDDVLTYLIHSGYLWYDQNTQSAFVPNEEIRIELKDAVEILGWSI